MKTKISLAVLALIGNTSAIQNSFTFSISPSLAQSDPVVKQAEPAKNITPSAKVVNKMKEKAKETPAELPSVPAGQSGPPLDIPELTKNNAHGFHYNPFGPENPLPMREISKHQSDHYDQYSEKEIKEMIEKAQAQQKKKALVQKPSDSFPTAGYGYGTYDGTNWSGDCTNTVSCPRRFTSPGIDNSAIIYPNLASAEPAGQPVSEVDNLTVKEKEAYKKELVNNLEPMRLNQKPGGPRTDPHPNEIWVPVQSEDFGNYHEGCRQGENGSISCPINGKLVGQYSLQQLNQPKDLYVPPQRQDGVRGYNSQGSSQDGCRQVADGAIICKQNGANVAFAQDDKLNVPPQRQDGVRGYNSQGSSQEGCRQVADGGIICKQNGANVAFAQTKPRTDPHPNEIWVPVQSEDFGNYHEGCRQGENGSISCPLNGKLVGQYSLQQLNQPKDLYVPPQRQDGVRGYNSQGSSQEGCRQVADGSIICKQNGANVAFAQDDKLYVPPEMDDGVRGYNSGGSYQEGCTQVANGNIVCKQNAQDVGFLGTATGHVQQDLGEYKDGCRLGQNGTLICPGDANQFIQMRNRIQPMPMAQEEPVEVENQEEQKLLDARNPYNGNVNIDGKQYFWDKIAAGKSVEVGGANNWVGLRNRIQPVPTEDREADVIENPVEQGLLDNRNAYTGHVNQNGTKIFWDEAQNGKTVEVGGVNTGSWIGMRNRIEPMPTAQEESVEVENQEEQKLLDARNPYDGLVHMNGKKYFWKDIAAGKSVEVGGINNYMQKRQQKKHQHRHHLHHYNSLMQRSRDDSETEPTFFDGGAWAQGMPESLLQEKIPSHGPLKWAN